MSAQRTSFGKLERDRAKKARAAAKRERRQGRGSEQSSAPSAVEPGSDDATSEVLERLASVHEQYDAGRISYEELEEQKAELLGRLEIH
jgi:hypothetical protein